MKISNYPARALLSARRRLRSMTRAEAVERLGEETDVPDGEASNN